MKSYEDPNIKPDSALYPEVDFSVEPEDSAADELYYMAQDAEPIEAQA